MQGDILKEYKDSGELAVEYLYREAKGFNKMNSSFYIALTIASVLFGVATYFFIRDIIESIVWCDIGGRENSFRNIKKMYNLSERLKMDCFRPYITVHKKEFLFWQKIKKAYVIVEFLLFCSWIASIILFEKSVFFKVYMIFYISQLIILFFVVIFQTDSNRNSKYDRIRIAKHRKAKRPYEMVKIQEQISYFEKAKMYNRSREKQQLVEVKEWQKLSPCNDGAFCYSASLSRKSASGKALEKSYNKRLKSIKRICYTYNMSNFKINNCNYINSFDFSWRDEKLDKYLVKSIFDFSPEYIYLLLDFQTDMDMINKLKKSEKIKVLDSVQEELVTRMVLAAKREIIIPLVRNLYKTREKRINDILVLDKLKKSSIEFEKIKKLEEIEKISKEAIKGISNMAIHIKPRESTIKMSFDSKEYKSEKVAEDIGRLVTTT